MGPPAAGRRTAALLWPHGGSETRLACVRHAHPPAIACDMCKCMCSADRSRPAAAGRGRELCSALRGASHTQGTRAELPAPEIVVPSLFWRLGTLPRVPAQVLPASSTSRRVAVLQPRSAFAAPASTTAPQASHPMSRSVAKRAAASAAAQRSDCGSLLEEGVCGLGGCSQEQLK